MLSIQPTVLIHTDESNQGWLETEKSLHINAKKTYGSNTCCKILSEGQNQCTCSGSNRQQNNFNKPEQDGWHGFNVCNKIGLDLWTLCLQRNVYIKVDFVPGRENLIADWESRHHADSSNWKLHSLIFKYLIDQTTNLFEDRINAPIQIYMSWLPDPGDIECNAILHPWDNLKGNAFPPFCVIAN